MRGEAEPLELLPEFLERWGWSSSPQEFLQLWLESEREVRPAMLSLIARFQHAGNIVGVAANQEAHRGAYLRREMGFDSIFDHCFISSELGHVKPEPAYYEEITRLLAVPPVEVLFIDDDPRNLVAAKAVGWETVLFEGEGVLEERVFGRKR